MEIASSFSTSSTTDEALRKAYADLEDKLGGPPTWMAVHGPHQHPGQVIIATLQELAPGVPFQGGTSCLGIMTEAGLGLGLFGIRDPEGVYAVGSSEAKVYSWRMGRDAIANALQASGKDTRPTLVWITCAPGDEEGILAGIPDPEGQVAGALIIYCARSGSCDRQS